MAKTAFVFAILSNCLQNRCYCLKLAKKKKKSAGKKQSPEKKKFPIFIAKKSPTDITQSKYLIWNRKSNSNLMSLAITYWNLEITLLLLRFQVR